MKFTLFIVAIFIIACKSNENSQPIGYFSIDAKIDSAVLLMYKLYSACETTILKNSNGKIDTLTKNISYLCLPVKINTPELYGDTTLITIFFEPENGYEVEDPKCEFAYSVGFIGSDSQYDFVVFGDNYYTLNSSQLKKAKPSMEQIFRREIAKHDCINNRLMKLLNAQK